MFLIVESADTWPLKQTIWETMSNWKTKEMVASQTYIGNKLKNVLNNLISPLVQLIYLKLFYSSCHT